MSMIVKGKWMIEPRDAPTQHDSFDHWITADGMAEPGANESFKAESGRYHLYASYACPFAHRALIVLPLKGLDDVVSVTYANDIKHANGWEFDEGGDLVFGSRTLHGVYAAAQNDVTSRVSVPLLIDKKTKTIVSNNSANIARMFGMAFDDFSETDVNLCPVNLSQDIESLNDWIHTHINLGVYQVIFSQTQEDYGKRVFSLFSDLMKLETRLTKNKF